MKRITTKELLAEYIACDNLSRRPIKGQVNKEQRLLQDVPQTKIDEQVRNRDQNPAFNNLVGNINPLKAIDILNGMASKQPDEFMRDLADSNNKQVQNEHKVSVPAKDTKVIEGNNQIVPTV